MKGKQKPRIFLIFLAVIGVIICLGTFLLFDLDKILANETFDPPLYRFCFYALGYILVSVGFGKNYWGIVSIIFGVLLFLMSFFLQSFYFLLVAAAFIGLGIYLMKNHSIKSEQQKI